MLRGMLGWTIVLGCTSSAWAVAVPPDSPVRDVGSMMAAGAPAAVSAMRSSAPTAAPATPADDPAWQTAETNDLGAWRAAAPAQVGPLARDGCQHRVDLYDYYGDGWTGNTLDVLVDEVVVLDHITLSSGLGPQSFTFTAATGATIRTIYHATGTYCYENYYKLYDGVDGLLAQDGVPNVQQPYGVTVTGNCAPPPTGACCHPDSGCEMVENAEACSDGTFLGLGHTCLECVCTVECPAGAIAEVEPCGEALDDGCNSYGTALFMPIEAGQTVCGTVWANTSTRDTDWYRFTTANSNTFTLTVEAEFRVRAIILQPFPSGCGDPWILADGTADACEPLTIQSDCRPADEYWLWVGPAEFQVQACANYVATLTCTPCYIAEGACCFAYGGCVDWTYQKCYVAGGHWLGENVPCTECEPYYCDSAAQMCNSGSEYIARVEIGTIDNASDCTYYGDYTALSTDVPIGAETQLTVSNGAPYWGQDGCAAWVDYNHDLRFSANEQIGLVGGTGPYKFLIAPPVTAVAGPTRLRVVLVWGTPEACAMYPVGETEDYTVNLCEVPGACCHSDGTCSNELRSNCDGTWGGAFTTCSFDDCNENGVDDFCDIQSTNGDCNANGLLDKCEPGIDLDCNMNDQPDFCDIALGHSHDLNGNGVPDECDIDNCPANEPWCADCNQNGVPDGCETVGHDSESFRLDDGTHENSIGLGHYGGYLVWLNSFLVSGTDVRLTRLEIAYGSVANGTPVTVYVWSDPDGDGNPQDARVLASVNTVVANSDLNNFNVLDIPPTDVGPAGSRFFVGAIVQQPAGVYPASVDEDAAAGQSWLGGDSIPPDPNRLDQLSIAMRVIDSYGFPGNLLIRAEAVGDCNGNDQPDDCDVPPACQGTGCSTDCDDDGTPDECEPDCNGNGQADDCDISSGISLDCNVNGVPDECELATSDCNENDIPDDCDLANCPPDDPACADCNINGIPDGCDIASGLSRDCQPDGIPDECQLEIAAQNEVLQWDDGSCENSLGLTEGGEICWLQHFTVARAATVLDISTGFGSAMHPGQSGVSAGQPFRVYLWSDPNGDGNPADAVLLAEAAGTVSHDSIDRDVPQSVRLHVPVSGSFFIGASVAVTSGGPAPMDLNGPLAHQAWVAYNSTPFDPGNVAANLINADAGGFSCNWLLRAQIRFGPPANDCNENDVPDECDIGVAWGGHCTGPACSTDQDHNGIPDECEACRGDLDCDGEVGFADINPFVLRLVDPAGYVAAHPNCADGNGDVNGNGTVGFDDINPFVSLLTSNPLPIVCP